MGRRVLRSTAQENSPETPENSPKFEFSTPVEKVFPLYGKIAKTFSIVWKNRQNFFHFVEKPASLFHSVETFFP